MVETAPGFVTVTATLAGEIKSAAGTCTEIEVAVTSAGVRMSEPKLTTELEAKFVPAMVKYCKSALPVMAMGGDKAEIKGGTGGGGGGVVSVKKTVPVVPPTSALTYEGPATLPVTRPVEDTEDEPSAGGVHTAALEIGNELPYWSLPFTMNCWVSPVLKVA